ncbi:MAG: VCBS repeat-containing protein, partial [Bacteroidota bacterium]|nr:VCBS repeat-containing protein [Bacteroidota bacterium]
MKKLLLLLIIIGFIFQTKAQISAIPPTLTFSYVEGQAAPSEQSVSVNSFGSNDITVTSSFPFSVSNTSGGGYSTSTTLPPGLSTLYVVIESGLIANNYSGIINFDDGSQTNTLPVDGFVTPVSATPTVIYFPLSFETFTANPNTNSAEQSIFVTGTDLAGDIFFDVSAGSDFEVSVSSGGIFGDQVKINQGVGSGTIYVRMKPGANTIALDNLSISTSGLIPSQSISLFGERILPPISITSINPNPLVRGGEVTITGSRFFAPIEVFIPGRAKISTTILDTNTFTFPFPSNYAQNTVTITFTGASKSIVQTYPVIGSVLPPDISLITPGRISAFNQLLVYGSNFPDINSLAINLGGKASIVNNAQLALLELYPSTGISAKGQIQVVDTQSGLQSTSTQHFFTSYFPSNTTITSQSFGVPNVLNIGTDVTSFESADFDGDNKMDIAVLSATNNSITFLKNPFISANSTLALSDNYGTIKYVDFNGDGKLDLFAWGKSTNKLSVFLNTSNSATGISFNPTPVSITTTNNMNDATFFDFNKDGKIDILASQQGSSALEFWLNNTSISGLSFNSSPFLYSTATISSGISAQNITIIDRDNDNDMDLVLQDVSDPNAYYNLENNSTVGSISFNYDGTFPGTNLTTDIKVANVNGSSDNSIIAIQNPGSSLNIISYASGYNYNTKNTNIAITKFETGNFDGDNYNDIAAIMPSTNQVGVFRVADSSGTPSHIYNPILLNTQSNPIDIDVEDYNNDGQPDIAVLNAGSQSVQIFPNVAGQITSLSITGFRNEITLLNDTIVLGFEYNPQDANQFDLDWTVTGVGEAVLDYYQSYNATDKIILTAIDNGVVTVTATTLQKVKAQYIITISGQVAPPDILSSAMQLVPGDKYSVTTLTTQGLAKILSSPPGVSQTWNITNAVTTGDSSLVEIVDAFSTPYFFSNFLNSVLASKKDDKYTYYSYS